MVSPQDSLFKTVPLVKMSYTEAADQMAAREMHMVEAVAEKHILFLILSFLLQ
jgi:hypothetical protein